MLIAIHKTTHSAVKRNLITSYPPPLSVDNLNRCVSPLFYNVFVVDKFYASFFFYQPAGKSPNQCYNSVVY